MEPICMCMNREPVVHMHNHPTEQFYTVYEPCFCGNEMIAHHFPISRYYEQFAPAPPVPHPGYYIFPPMNPGAYLVPGILENPEHVEADAVNGENHLPGVHEDTDNEEIDVVNEENHYPGVHEDPDDEKIDVVNEENHLPGIHEDPDNGEVDVVNEENQFPELHWNPPNVAENAIYRPYNIPAVHGDPYDMEVDLSGNVVPAWHFNEYPAAHEVVADLLFVNDQPYYAEDEGGEEDAEDEEHDDDYCHCEECQNGVHYDENGDEWVALDEHQIQHFREIFDFSSADEGESIEDDSSPVRGWGLMSTPDFEDEAER